jgi:hypothetical protein
VSHNVTRGKQDEIARKRRLAEIEPYLVPGWQIDPSNVQIVPVRTVLGHYERGQQLLLRCKRADCRRRMEVDLLAAIQAGKGHLPPHHLVHMLKCNHWAGCQFEEASAIYPNGVPLIGFLNEEGVLIAIACASCGASVLLQPRAVIARLKQAGRGDGSTGVLEVGKRIRGPCRKCGGRLFEAELIRPKAPGT